MQNFLNQTTLLISIKIEENEKNEKIKKEK